LTKINIYDILQTGGWKMKCAKCGFNITDENFCPKCGKEVVVSLTLNGTVFEAVLENTECLGTKRRIIFVDHEKHKDDQDRKHDLFKSILAGFSGLFHYYPDIFVWDKGILKDTGEPIHHIEEQNIFTHFSDDELLIEERFYGNIGNITFLNKVIQIETENLIRVEVGDFFWIMPKNSNSPTARGKIIKVIKSRKYEGEE
jgi:hypothetical protein